MGKVTPMPQPFPAAVKALLAPRKAVVLREHERMMDIVKGWLVGQNVDLDRLNVTVDFDRETYTLPVQAPEAG